MVVPIDPEGERMNTTDLTPHPARAAAQYPIVKGRCPACGYRSLFLAAGGYVTCSVIPCPDPGAASDLLDPEEAPGE